MESTPCGENPVNERPGAAFFSLPTSRKRRFSCWRDPCAGGSGLFVVQRQMTHLSRIRRFHLQCPSHVDPWHEWLLVHRLRGPARSGVSDCYTMRYDHSLFTLPRFAFTGCVHLFASGRAQTFAATPNCYRSTCRLLPLIADTHIPCELPRRRAPYSSSAVAGLRQWLRKLHDKCVSAPNGQRCTVHSGHLWALYI